MDAAATRAYAGYTDELKEQLGEALGVFGKTPAFRGFDGNNEGEYIGIARFLVDGLNRFERFKGRDLKSHIPTVARYDNMAQRFDAIRPNLHGRELNVTAMIDLLQRESR